MNDQPATEDEVFTMAVYTAHYFDPGLAEAAARFVARQWERPIAVIQSPTLLLFNLFDVEVDPTVEVRALSVWR
jgi:hypothetical protein